MLHLKSTLCVRHGAQFSGTPDHNRIIRMHEHARDTHTGDTGVSLHGRAKKRAALVSIVSNICLTVLKLAAGIFTGSVAILSEAAHSGMDLVAALMAYISVRVADRPPDAGHPYGHGKAENIAALFEGLLIVAAGGMIIWESAAALLVPHTIPGLGAGAAVMLFSGVVNILVSRHLFRVGKRTESDALIADAWHLRTDVYTSLGVFAALGCIMLGEHLLPGRDFSIIDPLCALAVAMIIFKTGFSLSLDAVNKLLDQSLSPEDLELIMRHIRISAPYIKGYGEIRTRRSGSSRIIYMELKVDGSMNVDEAHRRGEELADSIREHFPDSRIEFHLEPE